MNGTTLGQEIIRKLFHLLTLVYLWSYWRLGPARTTWLLGIWVALEGSLELIRLRTPVLNRRLIAAFGSIRREDEESRVSGIFWTALGCWLTILAFGRWPNIVSAAILYLALGDAAAAIVGKAVGHTRLPLKIIKTWEGSLACLLVCAGIGWYLGFGVLRIWMGALAATIIESVPMPYNDNLWLPLGGAFVLWVKFF